MVDGAIRFAAWLAVVALFPAIMSSTIGSARDGSNLLSSYWGNRQTLPGSDPLPVSGAASSRVFQLSHQPSVMSLCCVRPVVLSCRSFVLSFGRCLAVLSRGALKYPPRRDSHSGKMSRVSPASRTIRRVTAVTAGSL